MFLTANTDYCSGLGLASAGNRYQEVLAWRAEEEDKINVSCLNWPIHKDKEVGPIDLLGRMPSRGALSCLIGLDSDALPMRKNIRFELYPSIVVQAPIDIQRLIKDPFDNPITISPMTVAVPQPAPVDEKKAIETRLCQLWQKLLPVEKVGLHDNFFLLGGDSLLAIRLSYCISEALSVDVPVALLFQYPTVAELTPHLTQHVSTIPGRGLTCGPMSSTQQRLWFIEQYEQGTSAYHVPQLLQLANETVGEQLTMALQLLVVRHPILRTRFFLDDQGQRVQQVGEEALSIRHCPVHPGELDNALTKAIQTPFDLSQDYPLRVVLFDTGEHPVLLMLLHHIAVDGWSMEILCRELARLCQAGVRDQAAMETTLPPLPIDYLDYTLWQQDIWQQSLMTRQSRWWQQQLTGLEPLNLSLDYPRPQQFDYRGQRCEFTLTKTLSSRLQQLARDQQTTLYTVMLSAFALLLSRYSGQNDLAVGSPIANRHHPQLESLVGFFANTLVVRTTLNGQQSFRDLVAQVHNTVTDMQQYQEIPFEQLVEQLAIERDPSRHPLFQVLFAVQHFTPVDHLAGSDAIRPIPLPEGATTAKFDLSLFIDDEGEQFTAMLEYPVALFRAVTIERLWCHYVRVLEQVVADPHRQLQGISLLSLDEYQQIVVDWNRTDRQFPSEQANLLLHQLFEQQASQSPDHICLIFADQQLTNREVNNRANRLARTIQETVKNRCDGIMPPDTCVVVCCEPRLEINIAALAVLKAGCVYVPVNYNEAPERIGFIIRDCKTPLVLTTSRYHWLLAHDPSYSSLALDAYPWSGITEAPDGNNTPETLAYIIYTSGTTGQPKGAMIRHQSVVNFILDCLQRFDVLDKDVFLQRTAHGFDATIWEMFWSMATTCPTVIASEQARQDIRLLLDIIDQHRVSIAIMVPAILEEIILWLEQNRRAMPASMRMLACIGEPLSTRLANRTLSRCSDHGCLYNVYGPAEATIHVTTHQYHQNQLSGGDVPIGRGIANTRLYVLDDWHNPVPVGVNGSLYLGGVPLAIGYLNRPELTTTAFIDNPFTDDSHPGYDRLYRTGDLVRWLDSGELLYIGREDQQIKIRGLRIEPGEIEQCLAGLDGIQQAVVLPRARQTSTDHRLDYLVAWYIADQPIDNDTLREQLSRQLPAYMVPAAFMPVDSFPVTGNGKLDTRALPEPELQITDDYVAPSNATEERLCQLWASLLAVEQVGMHDNFFHLGGDSLLAIRLCQQISDALSVDAPVALLFQYPTIATLAPQLTDQISLIPAQGLTHGPMSFTQQRLWFIEQFEQGTSAYHIPLLIRLDSESDGEQLVRVVQLLADRHPVLRTRFFMDDQGQRTQQVGEEPLTVERRELARAELDDAQAEVINTSFDLSRDYPLRMVLFDTKEHSALLLLFHHIAVDGWSLDILCQEMAMLYQAGVTDVNGMTALLPTLGIDYLDFTLWQQETWQESLMTRQGQWWQQQLAGLEPLNLPLDYPRPQQFDYRGQCRQFTLTRKLSQQLQQLARDQQTTLYTVMLSAFALLLSRYSGQDDLAVGSPVANRHHPQLEPLVGFFANTLVVRTTVDGQQRFRDLVSQVHNTVTHMQQYQEIPFEQLVEQLAVERDPSRHPLFQVMFAVQHFAAHGNASLQFMPIPNQATAAKFDLTLIIDDSGEQFTGWLEYPVALFKTATIEQLWHRYVLVLEQVVAEPTIPLQDISLLSPDDYQKVVVDWNRTATELPAGQQNLLLHQLFEQQAAQSPDNICLIFNDQQLTNREVDNRANQLAQTIQEHIKDSRS